MSYTRQRDDISKIQLSSESIVDDQNKAQAKINSSGSIIIKNATGLSFPLENWVDAAAGCRFAPPAFCASGFDCLHSDTQSPTKNHPTGEYPSQRSQPAGDESLHKSGLPGMVDRHGDQRSGAKRDPLADDIRVDFFREQISAILYTGNTLVFFSSRPGVWVHHHPSHAAGS